jgi:hypothetical protein
MNTMRSNKSSKKQEYGLATRNKTLFPLSFPLLQYALYDALPISSIPSIFWDAVLPASNDHNKANYRPHNATIAFDPIDA